eukprot:3842295-Rhodomonas_salina.3
MMLFEVSRSNTLPGSWTLSHASFSMCLTCPGHLRTCCHNRHASGSEEELRLGNLQRWVELRRCRKSS